MYACEVAVLSGGKLPETLTYFFGEDIPLLSRVVVPLRKKNVRGIVVSSVSISQVKSQIKKSDFALKKIKEVVGPNIFRESFLESALDTGGFYGIPMGLFLKNVLPTFLFDLPIEKSFPPPEKKESSSVYKSETGVVMLPFPERISYYKTLIRESFARGESLYLITPTIGDAEVFSSHLGHGIEKYTAIFHSALTKKKLTDNIKKIGDAKHPILVIGTPPVLSIPRKDTATIILEKEASTAYISNFLGGIDTRLLVLGVAEKEHVRLIYADTFLRVETYALLKTGEATEMHPPSYRLQGEKKLLVVDMKNEEEGGGVIIGKTLSEESKNLLAKKKNIFLFALRHGFATQIVCQDCGDTIRCPLCTNVLTLEKQAGKNIFWCRHDKRGFEPSMTCGRCGSWRLVALGVGIQKVEEEARGVFGDGAHVFACDETQGEKEKTKTVKAFSEERGAVLVGTQKALLLLPAPTPLVGIVSFDTLLYLPHFAAGERILSLISTLWDSAEETLLIQTRDPRYPLLEHISRGTLFDWYRDELALREKFSFPPYAHIIVFKVSGTPMERDAAGRRLERLFGAWNETMRRESKKTEDIYIVKVPKKDYSVTKARQSPIAQILLLEREKGITVLVDPIAL